jgi:hypothetical protein
MRFRRMTTIAISAIFLLSVAGPATAAPSSPSRSPLAVATTDVAAAFAVTAVALRDPATSKADRTSLRQHEVLIRDNYEGAVVDALIRGNVNGLDDEEVLTAFSTVVDAIGTLEVSWVKKGKQFPGQRRYLATEDTLLAYPCRITPTAPCAVLVH